MKAMHGLLRISKLQLILKKMIYVETMTELSQEIQL